MASEAWVLHGGHLLPQRVLDISDDITRNYPNLELGIVDPEQRTPGETHPFAIFAFPTEDRNGEPDVVKMLSDFEMSSEYILNWLRDNDARTQTVDQMMESFIAKMDAQKKIEDAAKAESTAEEVDLLTSIATSNLHTYRHNGNNIGADNNVPTLHRKED